MTAIGVGAGCWNATAAEPVDPRTGAPNPEAIEALQSLGYAGFDPSSSRDSQSGVRVIDAARSYPGPSLYVNAVLCSAVLLAHDGKVLRTWSMRPCGRWYQATLLESGDLVVAGSDSAVEDGAGADLARRYLVKLAWNGELLWRRALAVHHDVQRVLPDGLVALTIEERQAPDIDARFPVRDNRIVRLSQSGESPDGPSLLDLFRSPPAMLTLLPVRKIKKGGVDLFHANAVQWIERPPASMGGTSAGGPAVLVTIRHQNVVALVEWSSRKLLWSWGQDAIAGPHDATLLDNGHVLVFDNGLGRGWSRVIEVDPPSRKIVWEYRAPEAKSFFTASRGSSQRLPNGNTLIAESDRGHAFEVTARGEIVWEFWNPERNERNERATIVRMRRIEGPWIDRLIGALPPGTAVDPASPKAP